MENKTPNIKKNRTTFWILVVLFALPYLFAFVYFQYSDLLPAQKTSNHGDLITPVRSIEKISLIDKNGKEMKAKLSNKWVLLTVANSSCDQTCQQNLYHIRQIDQAMSANSRRVEKLLVLSETSQLPALMTKLTHYKSVYLATGPESSIKELSALLASPNPKAENGIYIIDPLGNYMMSYPPNFDANLIIKDLERLLKVSQLGA